MKHLLLILFLIINLNGNTIDKQFFGKWTGLSKTIYSLLGDVTIKKNLLNFQYKGIYNYKIISQTNDSIILKLNKKLECGKYIRIGPLLKNNYMEFYIYTSKKEALNNKKNNYLESSRYSLGCFWGIYIK